MKDVDRRKFLKSLFISSGALLMPSVVFGATGNATTGTPASSVDQALVRQAKQAFYKKNYELAGLLYKQLIELEPGNVVWYDGLRRVYGARQQLFPIASLYKQALSKNPDKAVFYDRLARSVKTVAMGSQQEEKLYKGKFGSEDLLLAALGIYIAAISKFPGDKSLRLGLKDVAHSFDVRKALRKLKDKLPATLTGNVQKYLASAKDNRNKPELSVAPVEETVTSKIVRMEKKKRRELYFDKEKENRQTAMLKQKKQWQNRQIGDSFASGNLNRAKKQVEKVLKEHSEETHLIGVLKKHARKAKDRDIVVSFYEEQYKTKKNFWTITGYAVALRQQNPQQNFAKIMSLYDEAGAKASKSNKELAALHCGRTLVYLETGKFDECRREVLKAMETTNGCGNISLKLSINYAKSYAGEKNYAAAFALLNLLKGEMENGSGEIEDDAIVRYIRPDRENDNEIYMIQQLFPHERTKTEKLDILYAVAKIQNKQGDRESLRQTIEEIKAIAPENQFILKFA